MNLNIRMPLAEKSGDFDRRLASNPVSGLQAASDFCATVTVLAAFAVFIGVREKRGFSS